MQSPQSFSGLTTTDNPSNATCNSTYSIPFALHAAISASLIGRDASQISISPTTNFFKPPPVPERPTVTRTLGCSVLKSSATASVIGYTVLEPSTWMLGLEHPETHTTRTISHPPSMDFLSTSVSLNCIGKPLGCRQDISADSGQSSAESEMLSERR